MSVYTIEEVVQRWKLEEMTTEQAIGQLLQHVQLLNERVGFTERRMDKLYRESRTEQRAPADGSPDQKNGKPIDKKSGKGVAK